MITSFLLAVRAIARNRVRAALTILGILIGVASLIAVTTLAQGVSGRISGSMQQLASNAMSVMPELPAAASKQSAPRPLTEADAREIAHEIASVERVAPILVEPKQVIVGNRNTSTSAVGTTTDYFAVNELRFTRGAGWTALDELHKERVCVIGTSLVDALFEPGESPLGRTIRIGKTSCRVVGTLAPLGDSTGDDPNNVLLMPIGAFRGRVKASAQDRVDMIALKASPGGTDRARRGITGLLRQRHRIRPGAPPDFGIRSASALQQMQLIIAGALSALLLCVSSVSLVVGGIGVMNIMLVSVAERTREIGIRISIGATSKDILAQFLIEAVVLTSIGGLLGLLLGSFGSQMLGRVVKFNLSVDPTVTLIAVGTSSAIGIFFGYLPARRAASLDPIQALRTD